MARCARRAAVPNAAAPIEVVVTEVAVTEAALTKVAVAKVVATGAEGHGVRAAGGAVAEGGRNLLYGLHAVNAVLLRAPERLLEIWLAQPRDDARTRELKRNAEIAGV